MILDLDHDDSPDPGRVGAKAAWLAMGRRAGLPVLPGFVVEAAASRPHMQLAAEKLATRGSGGARLVLTGEPITFADELIGHGARLGEHLVARSSTSLEGSGEWSGAFSSFLDLVPDDLPKAIVGCWASAYTIAALARQRSAGIEPGSFGMAVLVQPALDPVAGGTASISADGAVVVFGIKGSPAPLLQGWSSGFEARTTGARTPGSWVGEELVDLVGADALDEIADWLRNAQASLGVNHCEWALDGQIWLLQLAADQTIPADTAPPLPAGLVDPRLVDIARLVMMARGALAEELILPWALGGLPDPDPAPARGEILQDAMTVATELRDQLLAEVWGMPPDEALRAARDCMAAVLGPDPGPALDRISQLRPPEPSPAHRLLTMVRHLQTRDRSAGTRLGVGRWEPFVAAVVLAAGTHHQGTVAAPGIGAGLRCDIGVAGDMGNFEPRSVITSPQPIPNLAPLLWDAAGLVTSTGSPAAHLFESARSLGIPAVCGVRLAAEEQLVAIDGYTGVVATLAMNGDDHV